jgi:hypothetical protein
MVKTFTGPHSRFRRSVKHASFVVGEVSIYATIRTFRIEDLLVLGDRRPEPRLVETVASHGR